MQACSARTGGRAATHEPASAAQRGAFARLRERRCASATAAQTQGHANGHDQDTSQTQTRVSRISHCCATVGALTLINRIRGAHVGDVLLPTHRTDRNRIVELAGPRGLGFRKRRQAAHAHGFAARLTRRLRRKENFWLEQLRVCGCRASASADGSAAHRSFAPDGPHEHVLGRCRRMPRTVVCAPRQLAAASGMSWLRQHGPAAGTQEAHRRQGLVVGTPCGCAGDMPSCPCHTTMLPLDTRPKRTCD